MLARIYLCSGQVITIHVEGCATNWVWDRDSGRRRISRLDLTYPSGQGHVLDFVDHASIVAIETIGPGTE